MRKARNGVLQSLVCVCLAAFGWVVAGQTASPSLADDSAGRTRKQPSAVGDGPNLRRVHAISR